MNLLIRDVDPAIVKKLNILAAVAGLSREEFLRQLLEREGSHLAMEQVAEAVRREDQAATI